MTDGEQDGNELVALEKALLDQSVYTANLPFSLLNDITGNFSDAREIGRGGFGVVYRGVLPSGATIAVKKLHETFEILDKNFKSEVDCLVRVKHENTVRFLGYCCETRQLFIPLNGDLVWASVRERLLCFEYLPGCLADYLSDASRRLQWITSYQIIKGICEGVNYLHQQQIIHMDLKPQNVLLDDNMMPKIADFGLSRRLSESQSRDITKNKFGTMGYMAPEFRTKGEITFKTDVYSLGVIIMKILMVHKECSNVEEVVESWTNKFGASLEQVKACAEIGIKCMNHDPEIRPATRIIRGMLGEAEISNWSVATDVSTSTQGQISMASKLADGMKLMDDSVAPSQLQPSAVYVEPEDGKVNRERKGKAATVSVMSTLSGELTTFMGDEYNKLKETRKQVSFLEKDLSTIKNDLEPLELKDELPSGVKKWRDDLKEISFDMEDCIADFMQQFGGEDVELGFTGGAAETHARLCELHRIANQIEELKTLAVEACARREKYKIDDFKPTYASVALDPRLPAVYQEVTSLVGIDGPREEVANWLMDPERKLKVVSVVGFGGLGKTTLAKQVLEKIRGEFDAVAFFSVSQKPDISVLLNRLQLKLQMKESSHSRGLEDIIEELRTYLAKKRYLIVVDDLWDQSAWKTIKCAFPKNGNGSRIIVTTRVEDVASMACNNEPECIYTMKPLSEQNSRKLFSNRVFGSKDDFPKHLEGVAAEILKKCRGLPLAIITIASLLATQRGLRKHWESIRNSLGAQSATNPSLEEMNSILNLSYTHLPLHLQRCFLYLGMYPEDHIIWRDDLIKQWIAEGFVSYLHGLDLVDVGRSYFNELVNRSMILPSETKYGEVLSCTVHDLMLDLILRKCQEDKFLSVAYNSEDMTRLLHGRKYKVHRLSLSTMTVGGAPYDMAISASLSQLRSLILFNNPISSWSRWSNYRKNPIPPHLWSKYLRVLIITKGEETVDLAAISQLFQLKYLMVRVYGTILGNGNLEFGHGKIELPTELGKLVNLETLDLETCRLMKSIPSDIVHLPFLSYLVLPDTGLPEGIENVKSLRTLRGFDLKKSSLDSIMGLSGLINLRELKTTLYHTGLPKVNALVCSIGKLDNLECLCIDDQHHDYEIDQQHLYSLSKPFKCMEQLDLSCLQFSRVPVWMGDLHYLRFLELFVEESSTEEFHLLGELPSLAHLLFRAHQIPDERAILGTGLFPALEYFYFLSRKDTAAYLEFEAGAMPNLRKLILSGINMGGAAPVGMEHLLHLQEIKLYGASDDLMSAFKEASLVHPNHPSVK
ncbi:disease resistance protein RGA5-like isoform X2 [Triticum dicoccoides]|uniref:disease resistance protein RGA5-like isoform X2 n=1 Tax=Triticum dicoccoides TaxID=85692 RepID=UPI00188F5BD1|nr:disease resistance protein RGA5-like isoform X2 [Triticum dicoccoides]